MSPKLKKQEPGTEKTHYVSHLFVRLRNYFLTGLVIIGPLVITSYLAWAVFVWVDSWIKPFIDDYYIPGTEYSLALPGLGVVFSVVLLTFIGLLTANFAGRALVSFGERIVGRMPLVRNIYSGLKQIFETVLSDNGKSFSTVGIIEYPRKGLWAIIFISSPAKGEVATKLGIGDDFVSVFLPTTPNPTSGYLLFVKRRDIIELEMSVEDAAKLVISAGLVAPEYQETVKGMAEEANDKERNAAT